MPYVAGASAAMAIDGRMRESIPAAAATKLACSSDKRLRKQTKSKFKG